MRTFCAEPEGLAGDRTNGGGVCGMLSRASSVRFEVEQEHRSREYLGIKAGNPLNERGLRHRMRQGMMSDERNAGELVGALTRIERATAGLGNQPQLSQTT